MWFNVELNKVLYGTNVALGHLKRHNYVSQGHVHDLWYLPVTYCCSTFAGNNTHFRSLFMQLEPNHAKVKDAIRLCQLIYRLSQQWLDSFRWHWCEGHAGMSSRYDGLSLCWLIAGVTTGHTEDWTFTQHYMFHHLHHARWNWQTFYARLWPEDWS